MSDLLTELLPNFLKRRNSQRKGDPHQKKTDIIPEPQWLKEENDNLKKRSEAYSASDSLTSGLPSNEEGITPVVDNEGTGESIFTLSAKKGALPYATTGGYEVDQLAEKADKEQRLSKLRKGISAAAARSNATEPGSQGSEERGRLPYP